MAQKFAYIYQHSDFRVLYTPHKACSTKEEKMRFKNTDLSISLPQSVVNIEDKNRSNLFTWRGQFSPQLIEELITYYGNGQDVVFDPFVGSGTVLYESILLNLEGFGCEINPAAIAFASVYELANVSKIDVEQSIKNLEVSVVDLFTHFTNEQEFNDAILKLYGLTSHPLQKKMLTAFITGLDIGVKKIELKRVKQVWNSLKEIILSLKQSEKTIKCYQSDARSTPIKSGKVSFVITSPPYINVFNYHQNYRKSVESLGLNVLKVARSEIGANRKFRQNRFLTVIQYCIDMVQVFTEIKRIAVPDAKILFIVGRESNVRGTSFKNAELIKSIAAIAGFDLVGEQHRVFTNKFGEDIYEEILRLRINENIVEKDVIASARKVAVEALEQSTAYADIAVKNDIFLAIAKANTIEPSPILES